MDLCRKGNVSAFFFFSNLLFYWRIIALQNFAVFCQTSTCMQWQTIFFDSKVTADGDCSQEIKRCSLLGRKSMTNLDSHIYGWFMSLLFNILAKFATTFLPRRNCLLISWLQSPSAVILETKKIKSLSVCIFPQSMSLSDGTGCHNLSFLKPAV